MKKRKVSNCPLCISSDTLHYFKDEKNHKLSYSICGFCDLVFVDRDYLLTTEQEKARYEMHHNNEKDDMYINFLNKLAKPMVNILPAKAKGLDFGSGSTKTMENIFKSVGFECSSYDIFYFNDKELLSTNYDFISVCEVIEHLYNPKEIINLWVSMLNNNGFIGVMTNRRPDKSEFANWWYKNDPTHVSFFSMKTFDYIANYFDLKIEFLNSRVVIFKK